MLHVCHMSIVASQVPYASCVSYEYSGLPGSLCFMDVMSIVASHVPYASCVSYEYTGPPDSLCFMDVI